MKKRSNKKSLKKPFWSYKNIFFIILATSWCSGVTFFILDNLFEITGEFGVEKHPFQYPLIKIHSAAAFLMMISYGYFLGAHARVNWKMKPRLISGVIVAIMPFLLAISGYLLYYIASDISRKIIGYFHFAIGFILPLILIIHIVKAVNKKKAGRIKRRKIEGKNL